MPSSRCIGQRSVSQPQASWPDQRDDRRPGEKPHVGLLVEAALGQHRLVEQPEARRDETEERRRAAEDPERRRASACASVSPLVGRSTRSARSARDRSRLTQQQRRRRRDANSPTRPAPTPHASH